MKNFKEIKKEGQRKEALIKYLNRNSLNKIYRYLCVYDMYIIFDDDGYGNKKIIKL